MELTMHLSTQSHVSPLPLHCHGNVAMLQARNKLWPSFNGNGTSHGTRMRPAINLSLKGNNASLARMHPRVN